MLKSSDLVSHLHFQNNSLPCIKEHQSFLIRINSFLTAFYHKAMAGRELSMNFFLLVAL